MADDNRIEGWKQIGAQLGVTDRTAQRWAREEGLPVDWFGKRVFAYEKDLEKWRASRKSTNGSTPTSTGRPRRKSIIVSATLLALVSALLPLVVSNPHPGGQREMLKLLQPRMLWRATAEGRSFRTLSLPYAPDRPILAPDARHLFLISNDHPVLQVLDTETLASRVVPLPMLVRSLVVSSDGKWLFLGSASDGIIVAHAPYGPIRETIPSGGPVHDLAVTPSGDKLFAAMTHQGVRSFNLKLRTWRQLTNQGCPHFVNMDRNGSYLVVSHQCGGPGGREGHDSVEIFDPVTERTIHLLTGLPLVGGASHFSPDGSLLFIDGWDACETPKYDHIGCPSYPSKIGHLIAVPEFTVLKSIGFPPRSTGAAYFLPDGWRAITAHQALSVYDFHHYRMLESYSETGQQVWGGTVSNEGKRAYFARYSGRDLVILEREEDKCSDMPSGLVALLTGDGTPSDVIQSQSIGPQPAIAYAPGVVGQAFEFRRPAQKAQIHWSSAPEFGASQSTLTVYIKPSATGPILYWDDPSQHRRWWLSLEENLHLEFAVEQRPLPTARVRSRAPLSFGGWTHAAVVIGQSEITMFIDGAVQSSAPLPGQPSHLHDALIDVAWRPEDSRRFEGKLDEIAFWGRPLRPEEITAVYQRRLEGPCKP